MKKLYIIKNYKTNKIVNRKSKTSYKFTSALFAIKYCYIYSACRTDTHNKLCMLN